MAERREIKCKGDQTRTAKCRERDIGVVPKQEKLKTSMNRDPFKKGRNSESLEIIFTETKNRKKWRIEISGSHGIDFENRGLFGRKGGRGVREKKEA